MTHPGSQVVHEWPCDLTVDTVFALSALFVQHPAQCFELDMLFNIYFICMYLGSQDAAHDFATLRKHKVSFDPY